MDWFSGAEQNEEVACLSVPNGGSQRHLSPARQPVPPHGGARTAKQKSREEKMAPQPAAWADAAPTRPPCSWNANRASPASRLCKSSAWDGQKQKGTKKDRRTWPFATTWRKTLQTCMGQQFSLMAHPLRQGLFRCIFSSTVRRPVFSSTVRRPTSSSTVQRPARPAP